MLGNNWCPLSQWAEFPATPGIYIIKNILSSKEYVGKAISLRDRLKSHAKAGKDQRIHRAIRKHGINAFVVCVYRTAESAELDRAEIEAIAARNTYGSAGYNDTRGGDGGWQGKRHSPESLLRMREARLKECWMRGRNHTEETKKKISKSHTGLKISEVTREKFREAQRGKIVTDRFRKLTSERMSVPIFGWPPESMLPQEFSSISHAAAQFNVSRTAILYWLKGKTAPGKLSKVFGWRWTYAT